MRSVILCTVLVLAGCAGCREQPAACSTQVLAVAAISVLGVYSARTQPKVAANATH